MIQYNFYIGANNETGKVEKDKIEKAFSAQFEAFSIVDAIGYYKGKKESSVIVQVIKNDNSDTMQDGTKTEKQIVSFVQGLKIGLQQESILVTIEKPSILFF